MSSIGRMKRRIGILTGGGDVPGLNSVIKSVVYRSTELGYEVLGIRRGWQGLTHMRPGAEPDPEYVRPLDRANTRAIDRTGGTILHTSRTNPRKMSEARLPPFLDKAERTRLAAGDGVYDLTPLVLRNIKALEPGLSRHDRRRRHALVLGGARRGGCTSHRRAEDDGQRRSGHRVLHRLLHGDHARERAHRSAAHHARIARAHRRVPHLRTRRRLQRTACRLRDVGALPHPRIAVRPGSPRRDPRRRTSETIRRGTRSSSRRRAPSGQGGTIPEYGPADAFGHRHKTNIAETLADEIRKRSGEETLASELTYDLRSGDPDALDQTVAITFANIAVDLIRDGASGRMVAIQGGNFVHTTLPDPKLGPRRVDVARQYNVERFRPQYADRLGASIFLSAPGD